MSSMWPCIWAFMSFQALSPHIDTLFSSILIVLTYWFITELSPYLDFTTLLQPLYRLLRCWCCNAYHMRSSCCLSQCSRRHQTSDRRFRKDSTSHWRSDVGTEWISSLAVRACRLTTEVRDIDRHTGRAWYTAILTVDSLMWFDRRTHRNVKE